MLSLAEWLSSNAVGPVSRDEELGCSTGTEPTVGGCSLTVMAHVGIVTSGIESKQLCHSWGDSTIRG